MGDLSRRIWWAVLGIIRAGGIHGLGHAGMAGLGEFLHCSDNPRAPLPPRAGAQSPGSGPRAIGSASWPGQGPGRGHREGGSQLAGRRGGRPGRVQRVGGGRWASSRARGRQCCPGAKRGARDLTGVPGPGNAPGSMVGMGNWPVGGGHWGSGGKSPDTGARGEVTPAWGALGGTGGPWGVVMEGSHGG